MKNKVVKYYILAIYLCSTVLLLAQNPPAPIDPPTDDDLPIDSYLISLALVGIIYVFIRFKAIQIKKI